MTLGLYLAKALTDTSPTTRLPLTVSPVGERAISVEATPHTSIPGTWGVRLRGGGHLQVLGEPKLRDGRARWSLAPGYAPPTTTTRGSWTGVAHRSPADAGLRFRDDLVDVGPGLIPLWVVDDHAPSTVWAIHVHGAGSTRAGTLRGVLAASAAGLPSVAATYRNSIEGPRLGRGRSHLGFTESRDIDALLQHLTASVGAKRFILFGWSMGAQVILPVATSSRWAGHIAAIVLDSPALHWGHVLARGVRAVGLPGMWAQLALPWMSSPRRSRLVGLDEPLHLDRMDWLSRASEVTAPTMIHHGAGDLTTPFEDSATFAQRAPSAILVESEAGHTVSWNTNPIAWQRATVRFLRQALDGHAAA